MKSRAFIIFLILNLSLLHSCAQSTQTPINFVGKMEMPQKLDRMSKVALSFYTWKILLKASTPSRY